MNKQETLITKLYTAFIIVLVPFGMGMLIGSVAFSPREDTPTPQQEVSHSLNEWDIMKLAIAKTESEFDTLAVGRSGDWGILQITPIYVEEVNRILGEKKYIHEDAFIPIKSMEMFEVMQGHHNPRKDIDKAISLHNPTASSAYSVRVRKNMAEIRLYERIRNERLN